MLGVLSPYRNPVNLFIFCQIYLISLQTGNCKVCASQQKWNHHVIADSGKVFSRLIEHPHGFHPIVVAIKTDSLLPISRVEENEENARTFYGRFSPLQMQIESHCASALASMTSSSSSSSWLLLVGYWCWWSMGGGRWWICFTDAERTLAAVPCTLHDIMGNCKVPNRKVAPRKRQNEGKEIPTYIKRKHLVIFVSDSSFTALVVFFRY